MLQLHFLRCHGECSSRGSVRVVASALRTRLFFAARYASSTVVARRLLTASHAHRSCREGDRGWLEPLRI